MINLLKSKFLEYDIPFEEDVSLKKKTWIKTGGFVSLWVAPTTLELLKKAVELLSRFNVNFELVGHTSNIYYLDDYNPKVILSTINVKHFLRNQKIS